MELFVSKSKDGISVSSSLGLVQGAAGEMHEIVRENLVPVVRNAKSAINGAVKKTSAKIKAWAFEHMQQAQKLGRKTELFEKLINNPEQATEQLAMKLLLGDAAHHHTAAIQEKQAEQQEMQKIDDLLGSIGL